MAWPRLEPECDAAEEGQWLGASSSSAVAVLKVLSGLLELLGSGPVAGAVGIR